MTGATGDEGLTCFSPGVLEDAECNRYGKTEEEEGEGDQRLVARGSDSFAIRS